MKNHLTRFGMLNVKANFWQSLLHYGDTTRKKDFKLIPPLFIYYFLPSNHTAHTVPPLYHRIPQRFLTPPRVSGATSRIKLQGLAKLAVGQAILSMIRDRAAARRTTWGRERRRGGGRSIHMCMCSLEGQKAFA